MYPGAYLRIRLAQNSCANAEMQTGFAFRDKTQASGISLWDQPCHKSGFAHLGLFASFPSVWMSEYVVNIVLETRPQHLSVEVGVLDVLCGASV